MKKLVSILLTLTMLLPTACAMADEINVISREDGSGTRGAFIELFGIEQVKVLSSVYNAAPVGAPEDMNFICDPTAAILAYATNTPAIDEPSAGYIFTWDMLGNGQYMPTLQYEGEPGTHSEFIEGLFSADMKKTADDLGIFLKNCVG